MEGEGYRHGVWADDFGERARIYVIADNIWCETNKLFAFICPVDAVHSFTDALWVGEGGSEVEWKGGGDQ